MNLRILEYSDPLFTTEKMFIFIKLMEDNEIEDIQIKFQRSELLPGVTLKPFYVESWDTCFRTKYKSKAMLVNDADPATLLPKL